MTDDEIKALRRGDEFYSVRRHGVDNDGNDRWVVFKFKLSSPKVTDLQLRGYRASIPLESSLYHESRVSMSQLRDFYRTPEEAIERFLAGLNKRDVDAKERYERDVADRKLARKWATAWKGDVR